MADILDVQNVTIIQDLNSALDWYYLLQPRFEADVCIVRSIHYYGSENADSQGAFLIHSNISGNGDGYLGSFCCYNTT